MLQTVPHHSVIDDLRAARPPTGPDVLEKVHGLSYALELREAATEKPLLRLLEFVCVPVEEDARTCDQWAQRGQAARGGAV